MSNEPVTFINVFDVAADDCDRLVAILAEGIERVIRHRRGFVSARLLTAATGTRVINEAVWESADAATSTAADPAAAEYAARAGAIASAAPALYSISARVEA